MTSSVPNRKSLRSALASGLSAALVHAVDGDGKPLDALYGYRKSKIDKNFVICVTSGPANRTKQAQMTRVTSMVDLDINIFTIYAAENFSEDDSEDKADDLEKAVQDWLADHDSTGDWEELQQSGPSEYDVVTLVSGRTFRIETIPVRILTHSD
jgi:hypothetical protein